MRKRINKMESTNCSGLSFQNKHHYIIAKNNSVKDSTVRKNEKEISLHVSYTVRGTSNPTPAYRSINISDNKTKDLYRKINQIIGG